MSRRIRVLCVDDHAIVREGIEVLLGLERDMEVVGSVESGEEAVALFKIQRPSVTLMDLQLPTMSGVEAIRAIRREDPEARILVLTMYKGDQDIYRAFKAGAAAYLLKDVLSDDLARVIREVHDGKRPIENRVEADLAETGAYAALSAREVQVIELVAQGMRNKEIAASLGITEVTVQVHVKNILAKLNVHDRTAAVTVALRRGIFHM